MQTRNITLAVSTEAHHNARLWAAQHDVSLSAVVSALLHGLPTNPNAVLAARDLRRRRSQARSQSPSQPNPTATL